MPQMSPSLWLMIMIFTMMIYLILLFKLYFINMKWKMNKLFNNNNKTTINKKMMYKW